jgi:PAS domain-containing protein
VFVVVCFMRIIRSMPDGLPLIVNNLIENLNLTLSRRNEHLKAVNELDDEATKIKDAIWSLAALVDAAELKKLKEQNRELFEDFADSNLGVTNAVRQVLKSSGKWMSPVAVKTAAMKITHVLDNHRNPLGSVHTVLKRLADANEVIIALEPNGRTLYGWGRDEEILKSLVTIFTEEDAERTLNEFRQSKSAVLPESKTESKTRIKRTAKKKRQ